MHSYVMPESVRQRVLGRMGRAVCDATIPADRTALIVVDMQNYFCAEGFPQEVPKSRAIVPAINRAATAMRDAGGTVVWVQTTAAGVLQHWANFQTRMLAPDRQQKRLAGLDEAASGFGLFDGLEPMPSDMRIKKIKYSAFIPHSSDIDERLRARGIDHLLIAGTLTNVCCESTARDAMLLDYRVAMLSDANATLSDEEHAASLNTFAMFFGDVMTVEEAVSRLVPVAARKRA
jgi:ureidoacrylate peracid hydrolase